MKALTLLLLSPFLVGCQPEKEVVTHTPEHHNFQLYDQGQFLVDAETGRVWEMKTTNSGVHTLQQVAVESENDPLGIRDTVGVKAPDGKTYYFPDQAHADAFKKAAHIP